MFDNKIPITQGVSGCFKDDLRNFLVRTLFLDIVNLEYFVYFFYIVGWGRIKNNIFYDSSVHFNYFMIAEIFVAGLFLRFTSLHIVRFTKIEPNFWNSSPGSNKAFHKFSYFYTHQQIIQSVNNVKHSKSSLHELSDKLYTLLSLVLSLIVASGVRPDPLVIFLSTAVAVVVVRLRLKRA